MNLCEIYECNNGDIFAFVLDKEGHPVNCVKIEDTTPPDEFLEAAKEGFPDADPYDPDDFCGKTLPELLEEFEETVDHIAELAGYCKPILFPELMGCAGRNLFRELIQ